MLIGGAGIDTAVYDGTRLQFQTTRLANGSLQVVDTRANSPDGTDIDQNIEYLQFSDVTISTANRPPIVTSPDKAAVPNQIIAASSLFSVTDADGNSMTEYQFADGTADASSGHFLVNGVAQSANVVIDISAAQLAQTSFQVGSVSDLTAVRAFDGMDWSAWSFFNITPPVNHAPVVTAHDTAVSSGQTVTAASLFSVTDADGDLMTEYQFADGTASASSGHFLVNGVAQSANVVIDISAAQLAQTSFQVGSVSDLAAVRAFDGMDWSAWSLFNITPPVDHAPVVTAHDTAVSSGQTVTAASLFSVTDADGNSMTEYQFADGTANASSGHFMVNGVAQGANVVIDISAAQLAQTSFQVGSVSDLAAVRAFDGMDWSPWSIFNITPPVNHAPVVTAHDTAVSSGQTVTAASLFSVTDADGDLWWSINLPTARPTPPVATSSSTVWRRARMLSLTYRRRSLHRRLSKPARFLIWPLFAPSMAWLGVRGVSSTL